MGRGKFKGKPTGRRNFSTPEEMVAGTSARPRTFKKEVEADDEEREELEEESENDSEEDNELNKTAELSRREREEIEKQKAHERYMRLQEQGKTEQAKKDLERLALIRQQRAEAAKKREEEKAGGTLVDMLADHYNYDHRL
ncbi:28 kDa heat- and acid-stable phosphoprotein [Ananas comosus]|uniref:28 kDa heat-and acid-stable phosphoprotein n=1 Tax=Ananas comosus TaxID=4615 RepID=A0A199VFX1_ANACO|nr:28 kDa heat- and acid-stable phosphoprotein [Ananas comosus]